MATQVSWCWSTKSKAWTSDYRLPWTSRSLPGRTKPIVLMVSHKGSLGHTVASQLKISNEGEKESASNWNVFFIPIPKFILWEAKNIFLTVFISVEASRGKTGVTVYVKYLPVTRASVIWTWEELITVLTITSGR